MMNNIKFWLTSLLVVQLGLVALLWGNNTTSEQNQVKNIVSVDKQHVDKITITQGDKNNEKVTLLKEKSTWLLAGKNALPANNTMVDNVLYQFVGLKAHWPIATTQGAQSRFKVAKNDFKRHVQLYQHDKIVADFYLGTSLGFKKNTLRMQGDNNIYELALNLYDFPSNSNAWLDKTLLAGKQLQRISGNGFTIEQQKVKSADKTTTKNGTKNSSASSTTQTMQWQLVANTVDDGASSLLLDQDKVNTLVMKLSGLTVLKKSDKNFDNADFTFTALANNKKLQWQFAQQKEEYLVKRSDIPVVFVLDKSSYEALKQVNLASILKQQKN